MAHDCQESSISFASRVSDYDSVEWFLLGATASQPDTYSHSSYFPLTGILVVHTYIRSFPNVKTIVPLECVYKDGIVYNFYDIGTVDRSRTLWYVFIDQVINQESIFIENTISYEGVPGNGY